MEGVIYSSVFVICTLILLIYVLKFVQTIWLKKLDIKEREKVTDFDRKEQEKIFERKIKLLEKHERQHEIAMKK